MLLKRANTGYMDGFYSLPSGHIDGNEPANFAGSREAKEEVGVDVDTDDMQLIFTLHFIGPGVDNERVAFFFEAKNWQGKIQNAEPEKCSELKWVDINKLPENIITELKHFFENLKLNKPFGYYGFPEAN